MQFVMRIIHQIIMVSEGLVSIVIEIFKKETVLIIIIFQAPLPILTFSLVYECLKGIFVVIGSSSE